MSKTNANEIPVNRPDLWGGAFRRTQNLRATGGEFSVTRFEAVVGIERRVLLC